MTADAALDLVRAYWTTHLGFDPDRANGVLVARPQGTMPHYTGIYAFRHGYSLIISPPDAYRAQLRDAVAGRTPDAAFDAALLTSALDGAAGDVIGPAYIGVADAEDFTRADASFVRTLQPSDRPAVLALAEASGPTAWSHSAIDPKRPPIFGIFDGETLIAASSYEPWGDHVRAVGVLTHPQHRGRGHGRAVGSAATAHGLAAGKVMLWQTLESNTPSMHIAASLGYQPYARTIAIRIPAA